LRAVGRSGLISTLNSSGTIADATMSRADDPDRIQAEPKAMLARPAGTRLATGTGPPA